MANRISRPVLNVAKRAHLISGGKYRIDDAMSSDITEIQTLIESMNKLGLALETQEELRKRLMSDIAHELRNPVTIIKSHLEAFEDGVWEPTPERIRLTVGEIDRLSRLISEVGSLYSIEAAESSLSLASVNISEEMERLALSFDP
ncbi:MAG: histidine kinase dimerization/phospho-acceptor domain-containing protein, partial [Synergistaceae bacterium]